MLQIGKVYKDRNGREILIEGRVKGYSDSMPFVWSARGDWYDEQTGRFVFLARESGGYYLTIKPTWKCIVT